jgi:hypothetical protein
MEAERTSTAEHTAPKGCRKVSEKLLRIIGLHRSNVSSRVECIPSASLCRGSVAESQPRRRPRKVPRKMMRVRDRGRRIVPAATLGVTEL